MQGFVDNSIWVRKGVVDSTLQGKGNEAVMTTLNEPILIVVGALDATTRPAMSQALFAKAAVPVDHKRIARGVSSRS